MRAKLWTKENENIVSKYWDFETIRTISARINTAQFEKLDQWELKMTTHNGQATITRIKIYDSVGLCGLGSVAWKAWEMGLCSEAEREESIKNARKRKAIPQKMRMSILKRDRNKCLKCNRRENLQIDHIVPVRFGGDSNLSNLQTLCRKCNLKKSAFSIVDYRVYPPKRSNLLDVIKNELPQL